MGVRTTKRCTCKVCLEAKKHGVQSTDTEDKQTFTSGATSSEYKPAYHLIFSETIESLALRLSEGAVKHGDVNYQKCIRKSSDGRVLVLDVAFARDRYNHALIHFLNLKKVPKPEPNEIGAMLWFCNMFLYIEKHGFNWYRILNPILCDETEFAILADTKQMVWVKTKDGRVHKLNG